MLMMIAPVSLGYGDEQQEHDDILAYKKSQIVIVWKMALHAGCLMQTRNASFYIHKSDTDLWFDGTPTWERSSWSFVPLLPRMLLRKSICDLLPLLIDMALRCDPLTPFYQYLESIWMMLYSTASSSVIMFAPSLSWPLLGKDQDWIRQMICQGLIHL